MPFKSVAQQHYMFAHPDVLGKSALKEWSNATDYKDLPAHTHKQTPYKLAHMARHGS
jgi:hypothetical protein